MAGGSKAVRDQAATEQMARDRVIEVARSWIATPFHDVAGLKGVGVDCAHLVERVYSEAGVMEPLPIEAYPADWYMHRAEEKFVGYILLRAHEITRDQVKPGDMAIFKYGRCYSHGSIIIDWPGEIIHAHKGSGCVLPSRADAFDFKTRPVRFFSLW